MRGITYQTVVTLRTIEACRTVLAYADSEMVWKPGVGIDWPLKRDKESEARYLAIVKALLVAGTRHCSRPTVSC